LRISFSLVALTLFTERLQPINVRLNFRLPVFDTQTPLIAYGLPALALFRRILLNLTEGGYHAAEQLALLQVCLGQVQIVRLERERTDTFFAGSKRFVRPTDSGRFSLSHPRGEGRAFAAPKRLRPRRRGECASKSEVVFARVLSLLANVHPGMHVWRAAEIPEHGRAFNLPHVPHSVVADVVVLVEGQVQIVEAVLFN
jgi:hypothetical protein